MRRLAFAALIAVVVAIAIAGALLTPFPPKAYAQNPYIIGGTLEVPKGAPPSATAAHHLPTTLMVVLGAVAAVVVGAVVAYRLSK